ncbi:MAG TPA: hypothetical protein VL992_10520 [Tepidisphaeraceae bacterium]|nr:hypothetical protein [Tepidisphaeraceae bacterium]
MLLRRIIAPIVALGFVVAAASADVLYFTNESAGQIEQIAPGGVVTPLVNIANPTALAYDPVNNDLYVSVEEPAVSPQFYVIDQVTLSGIITPLADRFNTIAAMTFDSHGDLFFTVGGGSIDEISSAGALTTYATGLGIPVGIVCDSSGNVYAASDSGNYIYSVLPNHQAVEIFHTPGDVSGLTISPTNVLYAASLTKIYEFTESGSGGAYATATSGDFGSLAFGSNDQLFAVNGNAVDVITDARLSQFATISGFVGQLADVVPEPRAGLIVLVAAGCAMCRRFRGRVR